MVHNIRGRCWWYDISDWAVSLMTQKYCLVTANHRQSNKMTSIRKIRPNQSCTTDFSMHPQKIHALKLIKISETLRKPNSGCDHRRWAIRFRKGDSDVCVIRQTCRNDNQPDQLIGANRLRPRNCVWIWILVSLRWEICCQI